MEHRSICFCAMLTASGLIRKDFGKKISLLARPFSKTRYASRIHSGTRSVMEPSESIINILPVIAVFIDAGGNITLVNKRLLELTGYSEKDICGKKWFEILISDTSKPALRSLWDKLRSGQIKSVENIEISILTSADETLHIIWNLVPLSGDRDQFQGIFVSGEDVTQLKKSHRAIEVNELLFRKAVEFSPLATAILDSDYSPVYLNRRFTETFGYTLEEVSHMGGWWDFARPDPQYHKRVYESFPPESPVCEQQQSLVYTNELKLECKDGSNLIIEFSLTKITEDRIILLFKDITDIKIARKALILDELRLEALVELNQFAGSTTDGILRFSLQKAVELTESRAGYIGFVNEAERTVNIFFRSKSSEDKCKIEEVNTEYSFNDIGFWGESVRRRTPVIMNDHRLVNNTDNNVFGDHILMRNHLGIPVFDNDRMVMIAGIADKDEDYNSSDIRQVTLLMQGTWKLIQRKQNEAKIKAYAEQLAKNNKELESLDRMKDEFMANITHELKTPLIPIKGYSELMYEGHLGDLKPEQKKSVRIVLQNAERLQKLIDSLLYMQNIRSGNIQYHLDSINITDLLNKVTGDLLNIRSEDVPGLSINYDTDLPYVCGNTIYLEQVFSHILENAFKFTHADGSVIVSVFSDKNKIHVVVKDTGIGISREELPHIFKRFYQADGSLTRRYGGNGLGLYLCKSVVEAHGGSIWAMSEQNKGTEMHVLLPVIEE